MREGAVQREAVSVGDSKTQPPSSHSGLEPGGTNTEGWQLTRPGIKQEDAQSTCQNTPLIKRAPLAHCRSQREDGLSQAQTDFSPGHIDEVDQARCGRACGRQGRTSTSEKGLNVGCAGVRERGAEGRHTSSCPNTDPHVRCPQPPKQSPEPPAFLGCERSRKAMESSCPTSSTTRSEPGLHARSCPLASPPAGPRQERPATLQETSTLTSDPKLTLLALPALGQAVCANGFSHSHCGHGKGPTLLCAGVERWDASLPGQEGPEAQGNAKEEPGAKRARAQTQTHRATCMPITKHVTVFFLEPDGTLEHISVFCLRNKQRHREAG